MQPVKGVFDILAFNATIPPLTHLKGDIKVTCHASLGMGWHGFGVGEHIAILQRNVPAG